MWTADNYLAHHGIKGQKWGVRRFQREDGTFTQIGRQRHADAVADYQSAKEQRRAARRARRSGEISKEEYAKSKQNVKNARLKVKSAKADIDAYKLADKGKQLADKGESIKKLDKEDKKFNKLALGVTAASAGTLMASSVMASSGKMSMRAFASVSSAAVTASALGSSMASRKASVNSVKREALKAYEAAQKGNISKVTKDIQRKKTERNVAIGAAVARYVLSNVDLNAAAKSTASAMNNRRPKYDDRGKRIVDVTSREVPLTSGNNALVPRRR